MRVTWASSSKTSIFPDRICTRALRMRGSPCFRLFKSALPDAHFRRPRAGRRDVPHPSQSRPRKTPSPSPAFPRGFARPVRTWCTSTTPRAASTPDFRPWAECRGRRSAPIHRTARQSSAPAAAFLFLCRFRADARRLRQAARRLGRDHQTGIRQDRRNDRADRALANPAGDRDRDQARVSRTDLLQADALRLQQRTGRDLQVPVDARGQARL